MVSFSPGTTFTINLTSYFVFALMMAFLLLYVA